MGFGAASVAWSTSLCAWINFAILAFALQRMLGSYLSSYFWTQLGKLLGATGAASLCCILSMHLLGFEMPLMQIVFSRSLSLPQGIANQGFQLLLPAALFGGTLLFFAWLFRVKDLLALVPKFKKSPVG